MRSENGQRSRGPPAGTAGEACLIFPTPSNYVIFLFWGKPVVLATTRSNETRLPPLLPDTKARFRTGGTQNKNMSLV